jgi:alpha-N-acetylglucosamine transferase
MLRMEIWRHDEYDKILYLDGDTLPIRPFDYLFDLAYQLSYVTDLWTPCVQRGKMNGGLFVVTPSQYLYDVFTDMLLSDTMKTCMGGDLKESDQVMRVEHATQK